ncbi:hypothetical protein MJO28_001831 [Puccinia striiformis f. sp. tritici]|uniref:Uncharacterized protein n=1 Tax=Puccinia striiformis f. sp. tritici TaxID=168172 RepID=A0ACC0EV36_9BASI|nr:hypothetical protein Pst134EA_002946 [Puccinia striiformis f. sp. tritici]KAH9472323.1 hypothetical protein Pst134EA_002946 [Puccinia striiformis f. sp. tritici]KAI7961342.1 hypothetical protein MJO28_001831 [Puccinia striiformis f. sp. tritici]
MINKPPHPSINFFTHHPLSRSLNASTIQSSLKQPHTNQNNEHISRNPFDWDKFVPTASRLIESFGVFYNRSTDYRAALKYEELKSQGYRPVKRSKVNHRWWEEERKRGRVQPDHEQSWPLQERHQHHREAKTPFPPQNNAISHQHRHFSTSPISHRNQDTSPKTSKRPTPRIHHKHSPDVVDIVGDHTAFAFPDLDYTLLDSESDPASVVHRQLGVSPGAKGIRGLRPGSFLELRRTNQSEAGILVRTHGNGVVYVNRAGEIRLSILDNVMYVMHGTVPEDVATRAYDENYLIDGLNDPVIPAAGFEISPEELVSKGETIASARRACCRALRVLEKQLDNCHSILTKAGSYNLYSRFRNPDPQKVGQMTSEEGVKFLLDQRSADNEIMVFALHQQLMGNADMFTANAREMRDKSTFLVQSSHTLTALYTVRNWIATNSSELDIFVEKCKTVVQAHRQQKASVNPETPLEYAPSSFPSWTSTDRMFIEVFRAIAINQRLIQDQPYSVIAACILKKIGLYDSEATAKTWPSLTFDRFGAIALLTDLGILPAWQSVGLWNPDLDLTERITEQFESLAISSGQKSVEANSPSSSSSALPHSKPHRTPASQRSTLLSADDPADLLRHDFGDLPVFIIDDPGAQELDDGISIEPITQSSGELEAWIHVHVADPTAHLGPSDPISLRARSYLDTVYLPGFTLPMLPSQLIESQRMSLGSNNRSGRQTEQKTLSFSARINQNGEILEYKIRPGLIKNTKQLTYQTVTEVLDGHQTSNQRTVHIGPDSDRLVQVEANSERTLSAHELSQVERDHIQELGRFSRILIKNRVDGGAIGWQLPMAKVSIRSDPMVSPRLGIPLAPRLSVGTPSFSVNLPKQILDYKNHSWDMTSAQILVSEMMIMAGRLAGRFYVDESPGSQDFRLAFRSQPPPDLVGSSHNQENWKELRKSIDPQSGLISPFKFLKSRMMFMPAVNGLSPMDHFPLGINDRFGYCKVTSPLRRYSDLVAHWQIKNALLRRAGRPTYSDKQEVLSLKGMKGMIDRLDRESKSIVNLDRKMNISWVSYLLRRMISDRAGSTDSLKIRTQDGGGGGDEGAEGFKALVHEELTAIILRDPVLMRFTNRWTIKAYIPELGLRASLITDNVEDWFARWVEHRNLTQSNDFMAPPSLAQPSLEDLGHDPVGLRVPVYIAHINQEDHVILKIDHNRPNFLIESTV